MLDLWIVGNRGILFSSFVALVGKEGAAEMEVGGTIVMALSVERMISLGSS